MAIRKTIGGDRLGSGKKMTVDLKTYDRSTHDLGFIWRSTMSAGTLVPFWSELVLPGDTLDVKLDCDVKTHPTTGPLFGSFKVQLDVFQAPIRLYQSGLHNNATGIGMQMEKLKLPQMKVPTTKQEDINDKWTMETIEQRSFNPSSLLAHLNILGAGLQTTSADATHRDMNALTLLSYWDIYKNYYANQQEERGFAINVKPVRNQILSVKGGVDENTIPKYPTMLPEYDGDNYRLTITFNEPVIREDLDEIFIWIGETFLPSVRRPVLDSWENVEIVGNIAVFTNKKFVNGFPRAWEQSTENAGIAIEEFPLANIDQMREDILSANKFEQFYVDADSPAPYSWSLLELGRKQYSSWSQQALGIKTYQSDLFNNWMSTAWVDNATTGINAITAVDTSEGSFTIDALNLASKVYNMLNRIAISGGTYDDWLETVYTHEYINRAETPIYHGGLSKELVFQEVVNNSESLVDGVLQPLGTLGGKGIMSNKHKGGRMKIRIDEPSYIMAIVSLTPRVDYSQGNKWDTSLKTMDDLHKPALDEIGFQDLSLEQAYFAAAANYSNGITNVQTGGKQPAWINYMTNVNYTRGNFARNQMFMTLNRRYELVEMEAGGGQKHIVAKDWTTYIDPQKYNFIFADSDLTAQNFWVQIALDITARRKLSAKVMPNL